jgi:hypothetical protein
MMPSRGGLICSIPRRGVETDLSPPVRLYTTGSILCCFLT